MAKAYTTVLGSWQIFGSLPCITMSVDRARLEETLRQICIPGRGILAADESSGTIKKRFDSINLESTEEHRRAYRNMLFTTQGLEEGISGVILYDETVDQRSDDGILFPELLSKKGIVPGIKVDMGKVEHPNFAPESVTRGLDGLEKRLAGYTERSAGLLRFTKWRQVIDIGPDMPHEALLESAMDAMGQYVAICQHAGYIPITEPEVLMDGSHNLMKCREVTALTLKIMYRALEQHKVDVSLTLLKPNMVLSGKASGVEDSVEAIAEATLEVFRSSVPAQVPGIVFLSGGQTPEQATRNLQAIAERAKTDPWWISFSYGRALQDPALKAWKGSSDNVPAAQEALRTRARLNGLAQKGEYQAAME